MKVLLLIDNLNSGGAQNQIKNLAIGLKRKAVDVRLLYYGPGDHFLPVLLENDIQVDFLKKKGRFDPLLPWRIFRYARRNHITHIIAFLFTPSFYALTCKLFCSSCWKVLVSERSFVQKARSADFVRAFYRFADVITANAQHQTAFLRETYAPLADRIHHVPNGISTEVECISGKSKGDPFTILCVGRVQQIKNTKMIIRALHELKQHANVKVRWAGAGNQLIEGKTDPYYQQCVDLVKELELADQWEWLGRRDDIIPLMQASDMLLHASSGEGFPNVVLEAMSAGCIVLASDFGDHPQVISDDENGYIFRLEQPKELAERLRHIISLSDEKRKTIRENARQTIEGSYSIEKMTSNYLQLLA